VSIIENAIVDALGAALSGLNSLSDNAVGHIVQDTLSHFIDYPISTLQAASILENLYYYYYPSENISDFIAEEMKNKKNKNLNKSSIKAVAKQLVDKAVHAPAAKGTQNLKKVPQIGVRMAARPRPSRKTSTSFRGGKSEVVMLVKHTEMVGPLTGTSAFNIVSFIINPSNSTLFPWLSQMAPNFQKYRFRKLWLEFQTDSSTATSGKVVMSADFSVTDPTPSSRILQMQAHCRAGTPAWKDITLRLDKFDLEDRGDLFIIGAALPANSDLKTYHLGNLFVSTQGMGSNTEVGDLHVHYEVELISPQPVAAQVGGTGISSQKLVNGNTNVNVNNVLGINFTTSFTSILVPNGVDNKYVVNGIGSFWCVFSLVGAGFNGTDPAVTLNNVTCQRFGTPVVNAASTVAEYMFRVDNAVATLQDSFSLAWATTATSISACVIRVFPCAAALN